MQEINKTCGLVSMLWSIGPADETARPGGPRKSANMGLEAEQPNREDCLFEVVIYAMPALKVRNSIEVEWKV
jgi:hypothetical protein